VKQCEREIGKEYRVTGTGSYLQLLPEQLASLHSPQDRCSVVSGVPNGTLREDYLKASPIATSQETVAVDMSGAVAFSAFF
jgi:hypothetical protein